MRSRENGRAATIRAPLTEKHEGENAAGEGTRRRAERRAERGRTAHRFPNSSTPTKVPNLNCPWLFQILRGR